MSWKRSKERKKKLIKLYNKTKHKYGKGVWYDEDTDRYYKYSCNNGKKSNRVVYYKNCSNRLIRRRKLSDSVSRTTLKKEYDVKWKIF